MLQREIDAKRTIGVSICERLRAEIDALGFANDESVGYPYYHLANFTLTKDPYTGDFNLTGYWCNKRDKNRIERIGRLQFNSDGSFYAEYDVVKPHPSKADFFIEAVTAWGKDDTVKTEARLLPMSENA
jgi:hypothetical protein